MSRVISEFFCTFTTIFLLISPDSARDGSVGEFCVKVHIIYDTDKQIVSYLLNIPIVYLGNYTTISSDRYNF